MNDARQQDEIIPLVDHPEHTVFTAKNLQIEKANLARGFALALQLDSREQAADDMTARPVYDAISLLRSARPG